MPDTPTPPGHPRSVATANAPRRTRFTGALAALMAPSLAVILSITMFAVGLPSVRDEYALGADAASWLVVAYTLPFIVFMPLYGRLGEALGKRRLLLLGVLFYLAGSVIVLLAQPLWVVLGGRILQGVGSAGVNPLSMAIIIELAPVEKRGTALGTWNSIGPVSGMVGPLLAGALIDAYGWRSLFLPPAAAAAIALVLVVLLVPRHAGARQAGKAGGAGGLRRAGAGSTHHAGAPGAGKAGGSGGSGGTSAPGAGAGAGGTGGAGAPGGAGEAERRTQPAAEVLREFDWPGVVLLSLAISMFVFYTSSRPLTGVAPFRDLRLLATAAASLAAFLAYERRRSDPFVDPRLFRNRDFSFAGICVGIRMMLMGGVGFIVPLMVTDLYNFSAPQAGAMLALHAGALLVTMRLGGRIVDRYRSRTQVVAGLGLEGVSMLLLVLIPEGGAAVPLLTVALALHGLGAGLCLAALHLFALGNVEQEQAATAAGLYSMLRFIGSMIGPAVGGVLLYLGTERFGVETAAYRPAFLFYLVGGLVGAASAFGLSKRLPGG